MVIAINELDQIWEHDVLGRRSDAKYLHNYLCSRYETNPKERGFVLAVNAEWGYGKSFMLERWRNEAEFQGHPAVYFDAWKNDYTPDPLLAFISELEEGLAAHFQRLPIAAQKTNALKALKKALKPAATIIATTALKHVTGHSLQSIKEILIGDAEEDGKSVGDEVFEGTKEASKKIAEAIKAALEPHKTVKEAIKRFKEDLTQLVNYLHKTEGVRLPIFIFVDELDRCRPDYAIELIEGIKHLFGVPGLNFVVATNLQQLSEAIRAVYGSGFDGHRYLQRFFDLQYTLTRPDNLSFSKLALEKIEHAIPALDLIVYGLEDDPIAHPQQAAPYKTLDYLANVVSMHADNFNLSLRDISQIATMLEACFITLKNERTHIFFLVLLAVIYKLDPVVFKKIHLTKTIYNNSAYNLLLEKGETASLTFCKIDDYGRRNGTSVLSLTEINRIYFDNIEKSEFHNSNADNFPYRNFDPKEYDKPSRDRKHVARFYKYFSIIEQAGGFISKNKK